MLGVTGLLAIVGLCAVASAAASGSGKAAGNVMSGATRSSLVHRLDTCLPAAQTRPTVVLVHGAWADASSWSGEVATLQAAGYDVRAIANPLKDLTTDSEYVAD
jgi:pimeloyl-ACP methyl ester carboxylesterase